MATVIQNLIEHALGDGARAAKFDIQVQLPNSGYFPDSDALTALAKTSSFPGKTNEIIDFKLKGRTIPLKGQVKYEQSWECTFYLTEDHNLKNVFESWLESLDQKHNYQNYTTDDPNKVVPLQKTHHNNGYYTSNMFVNQYNFELDEIPVTYQLFNVFPIAVSNVEVSAESVGTVSEFTVTFAYSHYEIFAAEAPAPSIADNLTSAVKGLISDAVGSVFGAGQDLINEHVPVDNITSEVRQTANGAISDLSKLGKSMLD